MSITPKSAKEQPPKAVQAEPAQTVAKAEPKAKPFDLNRTVLELLQPVDKSTWLLVAGLTRHDLAEAIDELDVQGLTEVYAGDKALTGADNAYQGDFRKLAFTKGSMERVLLFPPLEKDRDLDWVEKGLSLLAPGGILVAVIRKHDIRRTRIREMTKDAAMSITVLPDEQDRQIIQLTRA